MKRLIKSLLVVTFLAFGFQGFAQKDVLALIKTDKGVMKVKLYGDTPLHQENFIKLAKEGFYNGLLWHRVMENFMIQTGDPQSRNAKKDQQLGAGGPGYRIPPEFLKHRFHKKGALAAARQGDQFNPNRLSSGSQFYIVDGRKYSLMQLNQMVQVGNHPRFSDEQKKAYMEIGGTPHLDYNYTVFGEVVEGLDIIDKIAAVKVDQANRPFSDLKIVSIEILN